MKLAAATLLLLSGCGIVGPRFVGSGVAKTEQREVDPFTAVRVSGQLRLEFEDAEERSVTLTADDNLLERIESVVEGGTLHLRAMNGSYTWKTTPTFVVSGPGVTSVQTGGQSRASVAAGGADSMTLEAGGQSRIEADVAADSLTIETSGQSRVAVTGTATKITFDAGGQSEIDVSAVPAEAVAGEASGQSRITHSAADAAIDRSGQAKVERSAAR